MPVTRVEPPELRIALAMRGGVSLAVWMGGACSEIDALRRAGSEGPAPDAGTVEDVYRRLVTAAGYDSVSVDVVAGASAGGLNGALMGCSVVYGMRFDHRIRNLWLQLGDLGALVRRVRGRAEDSLLDGDGKFYRPLATVMRDLVREDDTGARPRGARLDLSLTGTLLDGRASRRQQQLGPAIVESRNRARFRFRHLSMPAGLGFPGDVLSDFGPGGDRDGVLSTLAYAARATSSFPGAFEPASVGYAPDSEVPSERRQHGLPATHYGVYSESRPRGGGAGRDLVIDGGVLDNIPVAWAVRSIARAPSRRSVDRWLVYLQPLRFARPEDGREDRSTPGPRETAKRARALRSGTETLAEDLDELAEAQFEHLRRSGFAQVLEFALGQLPTDETESEFLDKLFERSLAAAPDYRHRVGLVERDRVQRLWVDPMPVLGVDVLSYDHLGRINSDEEARADRSSLLDDLRLAPYDGVLEAGRAHVDHLHQMTPAERREAVNALGSSIRTPQFLARTVAMLLDAARAVGDAGMPIKGALFDIRSRIELLIACHDRYLAAEPAFPGAAAAPANELVRRAAWRLARQPDAARPDWTTGSEGEGWPELGTFTTLLDELVVQAERLARTTPPSDDPESGPARALVRCLLLAAEDATASDRATRAVLVAVELLTGPLRTDPLAESSAIRFHMLSAANQSPLPALRPGNQELGVDEKLAGNQVANFGAFLSARWRLNDWTWGRLDAAVSLVQIVANRAREGDTRAATAIRALADVSPDAPLPEAVDVLVARLHERILKEELPLLDDLDVGPPSEEVLRPRPLPENVPDVTPLLTVGTETVTGIVVRNPSRWRVLSELLLVGAPSWGADALGAFRQTAVEKVADVREFVGERADDAGGSAVARAAEWGRRSRERLADVLPFR